MPELLAPRRRLYIGAWTAALCVALALLTGLATAQDDAWEMRVCADSDAMPFTNRAEEGFENRIAAILAEQLGARLTYDWYPLTQDMITLRLREGECDLILGLPDGYGGVTTTVAYYRSPYVFLYRADAPFTIDSLDDPDLEELTIAVQNFGIPPQEALLNRGITAVEVRPGGFRRSGTADAIVDAVVDGTVDVGIAWGPGAGYAAARTETDVVVEPVTPQFEPPFHSMSFPMSMAVRTGDTSLRDRLDEAIAQRWDDIQAVLDQYDVPRVEITPPRPSEPRPASVMEIAVVSPNTTGASAVQASLWDIVGDAARNGALLGESTVNSDPEAGAEVYVHLASAPTPEAADRATARLRSVEKIDALVGGVGEGQAEVLAAHAEDASIPFFNVGSTSETLRAACYPLTLHIQASGAMYLDALVDWMASEAPRRWFVVHEPTEEGERLHDAAAGAVASFDASGELVGSAAVPRGLPSYQHVLADIERAGADAVLVLLDAPDQIAFAGQASSSGLAATLAYFPDPVTQTRDYFGAFRDRAGNVPSAPRIGLWETTLDTEEAEDLIQRYTSRFGQPMEGSAWAAYVSVRMLDRAIRDLGQVAPARVAAHLLEPDTEIAALKGPGVSFRPWNQQLRQPLYVVRIDPEAEWRANLTGMTDLAELVVEVPTTTASADPEARLDRYGHGPQELACP